MTAWASILVAAVAMVIGLKWLVAKIGCNCHHCGGRMLTWTQLGDDDRQDIMDYFEKYEKRTPATNSIFVCPDCRYVYDDFSGERLSMDGSDKSFCKVCGMPFVHYLGQFAKAMELDGFRTANPHLIDKTECLICKRNPLGAGDCIVCDTPFKVRACRKCYTLFGWIPMMQNRYLFDVPLTDANIIENAPTWMGL